MHPFERHLLRGYAYAAARGGHEADDVDLSVSDADLVLKRIHHEKSRPDRDFVAWLVRHAGELACEPLPDLSRDAYDSGRGRVDQESWNLLAPILDRVRPPKQRPRRSGLQRRLDWLIETLALDRLDAAILGLTVRAALDRRFHTLAQVTAGNSPGRDEIGIRALAALLGQGTETIEGRLKRSRPLCLLGFVEDRNAGDFAPSRMVLRVARMASAGPVVLREALLGRTERPRLGWDDFVHLGPVRDLAERLVEGAFRERSKGVNILLYGEPGTGKSEFARTLAARVGARASFIGETDDEAGEPNRNERISAFAVARALAGRAGRVLLVMDEADDVFTGVDSDDGRLRAGSKVFMNRLVETTEAPTLWITNHPDRLGPAVMRRMSLALRLPVLGHEGRRRMLDRMARRNKLRLGSADLDRVAALEASPAVLDAGLRVAKLTGGGAEDSLRAATSVAAAMARGRAVAAEPAFTSFDPALSAADHNLAALADRIAAGSDRALSFCFYGLPGTGKSAYARHLARRLGLDVVERRASDLLSMWVGGTEKGIAAAFEEAADRRAMLILDEVDSLLRDRAGARQSWEVSQVNEMLTRMEAAQHPFCCTTNLMGSLDPATLRRFLFKVEFRPMSADQTHAAFLRQFGIAPPPGLDLLDPLTCGDFAVVARKSTVLGKRDPAALLGMLAAEVAAKPGANRTAIGFTARVAR
ncbi:AAA family ATPase [Methylobacterium sp. SD274]|uniref:AAA family ATPase n=1 Tax=Methylobacterium sp. SD274 TaxID=2782009 RepID=UPI001A9756B2|nr:AAA family ATPase [Methylobacterium sp. SD274]MBO1022871.1 AAA family ATPase [Methylobacterium sp. SD274]